MTPDFEKDSFLSLKRLAANNHYYNEVFKRTERIASVVFYVLSYVEVTDRTQVHHQNLSDKAMRLHETVIATLNLHEYEAKDGLVDFVQAMVALESATHIATAARLLTPEVARVITDEIDTALRVVRNHYISAEGAPAENTSRAPLASARPNNSRSVPTSPAVTPRSVASTTSDTALTTRTARSTPRSTAPRGDMSSQASAVYGTGPARIDRIKTVLEAKGEATIKDIAEVITDCSEKTIQRDLNSLIEVGEVERHGERRWSRYTVVKS